MTSTFSVDDFGRSFERHLRAARKSPRTVKTYMEAVQLLCAFLDQQDGGRTLLEARRDTAIVLVLLDAGPRLAEVAGMRVKDISFHYDVARVIGKRNREHALPFGRKAVLALDRYLRAEFASPTRASSGCGSERRAA